VQTVDWPAGIFQRYELAHSRRDHEWCLNLRRLALGCWAERNLHALLPLWEGSWRRCRPQVPAIQDVVLARNVTENQHGFPDVSCFAW
jgi:hypothetical protein